jgi:tetratricopeptide (TPR) repeat protein
MYDRREELDKSEAVFKKILDFSPYIDGVLLNLTAVYIKMKKYDEAYEVIQRCDPKTTNTQIIKYREYLEQKVAEK